MLKKMKCFLLAISLFLVACGAAEAALVTKNMYFKVNVSGEGDELIFSPVPFTPGNDEDGFIVMLVNKSTKQYFLPEGQSIRLPNDWSSMLIISRAYACETDTGRFFLVGKSQEFRNEGDSNHSIVLDLEEVTYSDYEYLLPPVLNLKIGEKKVGVQMWVYCGPSSKYNLIQVTFSHHPRSGEEPKIFYIKKEGDVDISNWRWMGFTAKGLYRDIGNKRWIEGEPASLNIYP